MVLKHIASCMMVGAGTVGLGAESASASADRLGWPGLDAALRVWTRSGEVPGVLALVQREGRDLFLGVAGTRDPELGEAAPVRRDTIFWVYSITKLFTAAGVMKLHERGALDVHRPVADYLPEWGRPRVWRGGDAAATDTVEGAPVTIHHLLTHTAGLYYTHTAAPTIAEYLAGREQVLFGTPEAFLALVNSIPLHDYPGTRYRYSQGYAVLGLVIERVSGRPLDEFLAQEVFGPCGMADTGFRVPAEKVGRFARICSAGADGRPAPDAASEARLPARGSFLAGGGDAFSTADDLARFGRMMLGGGEIDGVRVLSARSVEWMTSDRLGPELRAGFSSRMPTPDTYAYGAGVATSDTPGGVGHAGAFGWTGNATTILQMDPKTRTVSVLLASMRPPRTRLYGEFLRQVYASVGEP
jgi:CubicO group peptidase (beta-lactamase class C family)